MTVCQFFNEIWLNILYHCVGINFDGFGFLLMKSFFIKARCLEFDKIRKWDVNFFVFINLLGWFILLLIFLSRKGKVLRFCYWIRITTLRWIRTILKLIDVNLLKNICFNMFPLNFHMRKLLRNKLMNHFQWMCSLS